MDSIHGIEKGKKLYKEERIIRPYVEVKKILRNTSIWSIFYVAGLCLGLDLKYLCAPWVQYWIRIMRPEMTYYWMIWYWLRLDLMFCVCFIHYLSWFRFVWSLELQQSSESIFVDLYTGSSRKNSVYIQVLFFQVAYTKERLGVQRSLIYQISIVDLLLLLFYFFSVNEVFLDMNVNLNA